MLRTDRFGITRDVKTIIKLCIPHMSNIHNRFTFDFDYWNNLFNSTFIINNHFLRLSLNGKE